MRSFYRSYWREREPWFVTASFGVDWKWWGFGVMPAIDFNYVEVDVAVHVGPFRVHFSAGKDE